MAHEIKMNICSLIKYFNGAYMNNCSYRKELHLLTYEQLFTIIVKKEAL